MVKNLPNLGRPDHGDQEAQRVPNMMNLKSQKTFNYRSHYN